MSVPIAVETFGSLGPTGSSKRYERREILGKTRRFLGLLPSKGENAASIIGTLGPQRKLECFDVKVHVFYEGHKN